MPHCPFCDIECRPTTETYDLSTIFDAWAKLGYRFSDRTCRQYKGLGDIVLFVCPRCQFGIFNPPCTGSAEFYEELSVLAADWYYLKSKWEYKQALKDLSNCPLVLDIGCGEGFFLQELSTAKKRGVGIELNSAAAQHGLAKGLEIHETSIEEYCRENRERFDGVCMFQTLEHIAWPVPALSCALECLKPGGICIITVPNAAGILSKTGFMVTEVPPHHVSRWTWKTFTCLADRFKMKIETVKYEPFSHYGFVFLIWERVASKWFAGFPRGVGRFLYSIGRLFLRVLVMVLSRTIRGGLRFVKGHSLYVILRKIDS
jgi:SAM-dependent methyltransferase